ncbi:choice-of-anchor F family protein [Octadecabacter sp. CECT 8868]|uniref:VPLPA-CTERM sorting domain-containing protein n=1 Tax=Octadecabacter algicola TaxID=2909342 RepID=UPI001F415A85|nr:choice-of-anchor F family protein [Octadecabacter algicola]MCF2905677.1 choice-of-anchor F family protein [Octadecabacter algicola]
MRKILLTTAIAGMSTAIPASSATLDSWNLDNVTVGATNGTPSASVVDNGSGASSGQIAYAPPEAIAPGIQVVQETYTQGGPNGLTLDGCVMTSNPGNTCTGAFQSGKRIKTQMTGTDPIDLVFDVTEGAESNYQVFYRLINQTTQSLAGFALELGFGVGNDFVEATAADGISFSTAFRAQPADAAASSTTQFPFGLFGDASTNDNFELDGFFAAERASLALDQGLTNIASTDFVGPYTDLFPSWLSQADVPTGAFWDNDNDPLTDALLMAWMNGDGQWEVRRDVEDFANGIANSLTSPLFFDTFDDVVAQLGLGTSLFEDDIEDLANLNVNFAINLADYVPTGSFTLRTTAMPAANISPVPLPAGAVLLLSGFAAFGFAGRRKAA